MGWPGDRLKIEERGARRTRTGVRFGGVKRPSKVHKIVTQDTAYPATKYMLIC